MWIAIFGGVLIAFIFGFVYLIIRISESEIINKLAKEKKPLKIVLSLTAVVLITAVLCITMNTLNGMVCIIHLVLVWMIFDVIFYTVSKIRKKKIKRSYVGIFAVIFTFCYMCCAYLLANNVWKTQYSLNTDKQLGSLRVALFADSHIGTTFSGEELGRYVNEIQSENPDVVVITGDFVDDGTSRQDMLSACKALSGFKTRYGVYFVFGNHDHGYYSENVRGWSTSELRENLLANGVTILEDENVLIDNRFYLVGRKDRSEEQYYDGLRQSAKELVSPLNKDKYIIMLDHQPHDYENEADAQADLVLSGHTHGGQLIPINHVGEWIGENCLCYGHEKLKSTDFIVTSGISDWELIFKTGCKSEYVIIDISGK